MGLTRAAADSFHAHVDNCLQCSRDPWQLCAAGDELLMAVGRAKTEEMMEAERQRLRSEV